MTESSHPADLSDAEWAILEALLAAPRRSSPLLAAPRRSSPLLAAPTRRGRPRLHDRRSVLDAVLHVLGGGLAWRLPPERFPPWRCVYDQFRRWRRAGLWQRVNDALCERARELAGRAPQPTAAMIDSRTARTSEAGGERGYDGGKRINGRKRHLVADTQGFVLHARVHAAGARPRACSKARESATPRSPACSPTWPTKVSALGSTSGSAGGS